MSVISTPDSRVATPPSPEEIRTGGGVSAALKNISSVIGPLIVVMLLWELAVRFSNMPPAILPPLSSIFAAIWNMAVAGTLWSDISATLMRLFSYNFV